MAKSKFLVAVLFIISIYATAHMAYQGGLNTGRSNTEELVRNNGYDEGKRESEAALGLLSEQNSNLQNDYNKLVEDYNSLRNQAVSYINAAQYQPRQPIRCSSTTYGMDSQFTSTSCY